MKTLGDGYGDDMGDVGEVDMFGLDEFGQPTGLNPMWGAIIGGGIGTGTAIAVRSMAKNSPTLQKYSEGVGLLTGAVAGGVMMAFPGSRAAGWSALATAFVTNGLRQLEAMFMGAPATAGYGGVVVDPQYLVNGLGQDYAVQELHGGGFGIHAIEPGYAVNGHGMGIVEVDPTHIVQGLGHLGAGNVQIQGSGYGAGTGVRVDGLGQGGPMNPQSPQAQLVGLGGPNVSGLASHYGATLFGSK